MIDLAGVPHSSGCYIYRDSAGSVIYVGKAKDLKKRVSSYFQKRDFDEKTRALVEKVDSAEFIAVNSEFEALVLENNLIRKFQPKFNINLKDARRYAYLELTPEEFPGLRVARRREGNGEFFGPFVSAQERDEVLHFVKRTLGLRSCEKMPKRACLRYHLGKCPAPCAGKISREDYAERVERARLVLRGKVGEAIRSLEREMKERSGRQDFEGALSLKRQAEALEALKERQAVERGKSYDEDVVNFAVRDGTVFLVLFNIYKGTLENKREFSFPETPGFFEEFLLQYYSEEAVPKELIVPLKADGALAEFLSRKRGSAVRIVVPERGEKRTLLLLAEKNVELSFFSGVRKIEELGEKLKLAVIPHVIECFDISHIHGTLTVGSMVQFREGKPDKGNYRRFRVRTTEGGDDYAALSEVITRRYSRIKREGSKFPDLIIVDGGKGQLSTAKEVLDELGLEIPLISIAKEFEEVYAPGSPLPLGLSRKDKALQFIQEIRDEAHRFAISYSRLLTKKKLKED